MLTVTEEAREQFLEVIKAQPQDGIAVYVRILGRGVEAFAYDIKLIIAEDDDTNGDLILQDGDLTVRVDAESAPYMEDATISFDHTRGGFMIENPQPVWEDETGLEVAKIIIGQINPSVGQHGGAILPVDVRDGIVYVRMMGGCQGCGLAGVTLTEGIEKAIKDALPQIHTVVDVTHHAAGENPYYA